LQCQQVSDKENVSAEPHRISPNWLLVPSITVAANAGQRNKSNGCGYGSERRNGSEDRKMNPPLPPTAAAPRDDQAPVWYRDLGCKLGGTVAQ
jgi:hypothetical protein